MWAGAEVVVASPLARGAGGADDIVAKIEAVAIARASVAAMRDAEDLDGLLTCLAERPAEESAAAEEALRVLCKDDRERLERAALRLVPHLNSDCLARGRVAHFLGSYARLGPGHDMKRLMTFVAETGVFRSLGALLADREEAVQQEVLNAIANLASWNAVRVHRQTHAANLGPPLIQLLGSESKGVRLRALLALRSLCLFAAAVRDQCREHLAANPNAAILLRRAEAEFPDYKVHLRPEPECCVIA